MTKQQQREARKALVDALLRQEAAKERARLNRAMFRQASKFSERARG